MQKANMEILLSENNLKLIHVETDLVFADTISEPGNGVVFVHDEGNEDELFALFERYKGTDVAGAVNKFRNFPFTAEVCQNMATAIKRAEKNGKYEREMREKFSDPPHRMSFEAEIELRRQDEIDRQEAEKLKKYCETAVCPMNHFTGCQGRMEPVDEVDSCVWLNNVAECNKCGTKIYANLGTR